MLHFPEQKGNCNINLERENRHLQSTSFSLQIHGHKYLLTNLTEINLRRLAAGVGGDIPLIAGGGAVGAKEETLNKHMNFFVFIQLHNALTLTRGTGKRLGSTCYTRKSPQTGLILATTSITREKME